MGMQSDFFDFAESQSSPEHPVLQDITRLTHLRTIYPQMLSGHVQGLLLQWISQWLKPQLVVEVGTFTGYSAFCFSQGLASGGCIHTIERNPEYVELIHQCLSGHGLGESIILHLGEAREIIPQLPSPIDLAYLDGDKHQYLSLYELLINRMRPGGIILADNIWWNAKVIDPETKDKDALGIQKFLQALVHDPRVARLMLPIRDGLLILKVL